MLNRGGEGSKFNRPFLETFYCKIGVENRAKLLIINLPIKSLNFLFPCYHLSSIFKYASFYFPQNSSLQSLQTLLLQFLPELKELQLHFLHQFPLNITIMKDRLQDTSTIVASLEELDDYLDDRLEDSSLTEEARTELTDIQSFLQHILGYDTL